MYANGPKVLSELNIPDNMSNNPITAVIILGLDSIVTACTLLTPVLWLLLEVYKLIKAQIGATTINSVSPVPPDLGKKDNPKKISLLHNKNPIENSPGARYLKFFRIPRS